mmetsp:Transcript_73011/g.133690  ORF Transcript_73011/g.133690 Transcript_73011/m.133690 type:complete len:190 (-) Transcript_73011:1046-1615(-)
MRCLQDVRDAVLVAVYASDNDRGHRRFFLIVMLACPLVRMPVVMVMGMRIAMVVRIPVVMRLMVVVVIILLRAVPLVVMVMVMVVIIVLDFSSCHATPVQTLYTQGCCLLAIFAVCRVVILTKMLQTFCSTPVMMVMVILALVAAVAAVVVGITIAVSVMVLTPCLAPTMNALDADGCLLLLSLFFTLE